MPGMLHGRVIRPPAIGAKLISVDESSIRNIPDVSVVRIESFLGVVASDEWAAVRAARELKATWSEWQGLPGSDDLERHVRESAVDHDEVLVNKGDAAAALPTAAKQLSAMYSWPYQSHASLGPSCAVADVRDDGATIWTSTQGTYGLRGNLAKIFAMPPEKLRVIFLDGSGSYGGNGNDDAAADAFLLSRNVKRPVRVQWMRQDEHGWDPKGPSAISVASRRPRRPGTDRILGNADVAAEEYSGKSRASGSRCRRNFAGPRPGRGPDDVERRSAVCKPQHARGGALSGRLGVADFQSSRAGKNRQRFRG